MASTPGEIWALLALENPTNIDAGVLIGTWEVDQASLRLRAALIGRFIVQAIELDS